MLSQSFVWQLMLAFKKFFAGYKHSVVYYALQKVVAFISASFRTSIIRNYVVSEKGMQNFYASSLFYRAMQAVFAVFSRCLGSMLRIFEKYAKGGFVHRVMVFAGAKFTYICGAFFVLMLILPHELWNNIYAVAAAFLLFGACLIKFSTDSAKKPAFASLPLSLVVFSISILSAVLISPALFDSIRTALFFIAGLLFMLIVWAGVDDEKSLKVTVTALIAGLFIMCLYAMVQKVIGVEVDPLLTDVITNEGMPGRVYATVGNPNNFAEIIVLIVPFVYALFFSSDTPKKKWGFAAVLLACVAALAMSYSRSGYVAFAISTVVFILIYDWRLILPVICIGILCIPMIPETVINRIFTIGSLEDTSNAYRIYLWDGTIKMAKDYFLSGIGIGTEAFAAVYPNYASNLAAKAPHSHMLYMELLVELGIVGITSFLVYMASMFRKGFAVVKKTNKTLQCMIAASISAFCGISFSACVEYIWFYPRVMFVFWIVAGILLCSVKLAKRK